MISVQEAKDLIAQQVKALPPKPIALKNAAGLTLAADVYAIADIPNFAQSNVDGYAFRYEDRNSPLKVAGEMAAGEGRAFTIGEGEAARIFTGAPLPEGADTVVMQEKAGIEEGLLIVKDEEIQQGNNVRSKGAEIMTGKLAMQKGQLLTAAALGFLSGIGISEVNVYTPPAATIIITGNELQQPGNPLSFGQVYDSNSVMLHAVLQHAGIKEISMLYASDNLDLVTQQLTTALAQSDLVLLAGGISVGDYDFVLQATKNCGIQQHFHKVKQKPGKPLYFGTKESKIVFGLPGNPSSALTCFYEYVLQAINTLMQKQPAIISGKALLEKSFSKAKGLTHFLKGNYSGNTATLLAAQESFRLASYAHANCLIVFDEDKENFAAGESIEVHLLPF